MIPWPETSLTYDQLTNNKEEEPTQQEKKE